MTHILSNTRLVIRIVIALIIIGLLAFFGDRIYKRELNLVYGRVFKKLKKLRTDIESLRSSTPIKTTNYRVLKKKQVLHVIIFHLDH